MANYATLKAAIAAAIKQNGNKEITGNLLQQQLLAMVNSLGVGYQYAGIATPATNPGTPDQNVFYLASTAGTYTNFGGLVLADGEIAILKWNGAWSKDSTGAASLEKLNQLGQQVIYDVTKNNPTAGPNNDGKFESLSALLSDANLSTLIPIAVRCGGMSIRFVQTSDNNYVQYRLMAQSFSATPSEWQGVDDEPTAGSENLIVSGGADLINRNIEKTFKQNVLDGTYIDGEWIFINGQKMEDPTICRTNYIPVLANSNYCFSKYGILTFYDKNKNFISGIAVHGSDHPSGTFTTPNNCVFMQVGLMVVDKSGAVLMHGTEPDTYYNTNPKSSWDIARIDSKFNAYSEELALGAVYDVSAHNSGATFASLSALLNDENLNTFIPIAVRKGGMSIKFVQTSDNKYLQYRLMSNAFSTSVSNWQGIDDEPTAGSDNLVKSGGSDNINRNIENVFKQNILTGTYIDGEWIFINGQKMEDTTICRTDYIPVLQNSTYCFSKYGILTFYDKDKNFISGTPVHNSDVPSGTFTTPNNCVFMQVGLMISDKAGAVLMHGTEPDTYYNTTPKSSWDIARIDSKINKDNEELSQKLRINIIGTNFVDGEYVFLNGQTIYDESVCSTDYIKVTPNTSYCFNKYGIITYYDSNKNFLNSGAAVHNSDNPHGDFTTPANCAYILIGMNIVDKSSAIIMYGTEPEYYPPLSNGESYVLYTLNISTKTLSVGTGKQYATLKQAIAACSDASAEKRYIIEIWEDQVITPTSEELSDSNYIGILVPNWVKILGIGDRRQRTISMSLSLSISENVRARISPINLQQNSELENLTIIGEGTRYAVHDDFEGLVNVERTINNVKAVSRNTVSNVAWGAGYRSGLVWNFKNCVFENEENTGAAFAAHNNIGFQRAASLTFVNCRFIAPSGLGARFGSLNDIDDGIIRVPIINQLYFYGCEVGHINLTEQDASYYGRGIKVTVSGYGNDIDNSDVSILNTDSVDYSSYIDLFKI